MKKIIGYSILMVGSVVFSANLLSMNLDGAKNFAEQIKNLGDLQKNLLDKYQESKKLGLLKDKNIIDLNQKIVELNKNINDLKNKSDEQTKLSNKNIEELNKKLQLLTEENKKLTNLNLELQKNVNEMGEVIKLFVNLGGTVTSMQQTLTKGLEVVEEKK